MTIGRRAIAAVTNNTRAVACSGDLADGQINVMDYITLATEGNATDFGDITRQPDGFGAGASNATRGVITGSWPGAASNKIDFITIATAGDATDFGDLTYTTYYSDCISDSHGGLA